MMVIQLTPHLEAALADQAKQLGVTPESLALATLSERFLPKAPPVVPQDEWERRLFSAAKDCGISPPLEAMTSEGLYD